MSTRKQSWRLVGRRQEITVKLASAGLGIGEKELAVCEAGSMDEAIVALASAAEEKISRRVRLRWPHVFARVERKSS